MRVTDSVFLVYGLEFLLSYVGTEAAQKGRFDSESAYFFVEFPLVVGNPRAEVYEQSV